MLLLGSLGLCGINVAGYAVFQSHTQAQGILMSTAILEMLGMILGAVGLLLSAPLLIVLSLIDRSRDGGRSMTIFRSDDK
jgi:Co/Zn/Cd efflux system component